MGDGFFLTTIFKAVLNKVGRNCGIKSNIETIDHSLNIETIVEYIYIYIYIGTI